MQQLTINKKTILGLIIALFCGLFNLNFSIAAGIEINSDFSGGNIEIVKINDPKNIELNIRKDNNANYWQWFNFKLSGAKNKDCNIKLLNAGKSSYKRGWENYQVLASYDQVEWFRAKTKFNGEVLEINHQPESDTIYFAYFVPYNFARYQQLIDRVEKQQNSKTINLGKTPDGNDIKLLVIGQEGPRKKKIWIIGGQHPGETMGLWYVEGMIEKLIEKEDPVSRALLEKAVFYIVPNMNIDGNIRGNHRTNSRGKDLNREWLNPSLENSPEVFLVREKLIKTGVNLFLDIHGDETLPYNFVVANEGIPSYNEKIKKLEEEFVSSLIKINPDFQNQFGYAKDKPGNAALSTSSRYAAEFLHGFGLTIEMPYKDNAHFPDPKYGWSGNKSKKLGESTLLVIYSMIDKI